MYQKVIKYLSWALLILSIALIVYCFLRGFDANANYEAVDLLFFWTYAMVGLAVIATVVVGLIINALNNPKSLLKIAIGAVAACAVVAVAYVLASGAPAVGLVGAQPTDSTLKLTDTVLNLTYFAVGAAILSVIAGAIVGAIRK